MYLEYEIYTILVKLYELYGNDYFIIGQLNYRLIILYLFYECILKY